MEQSFVLEPIELGLTKGERMWIHEKVTVRQKKPKDHMETHMGVLGPVNTESSIRVKEPTYTPSRQKKDTTSDVTYDRGPSVPYTGGTSLNIG